MTPNEKQGVRKAAIFVASLDQTAADRVLDQMPAEMARLVRDVLVELDKIDPAEQEEVIAEFRRPQKPVDRGVEIDPSLARRLAEDSPTEPPAAAHFQKLGQAEADKIARVLADERPQTIAVVLSHLPHDRAGDVLVRLSPAVQVDVLRRLANLEETDPEILRELERGIEARLVQMVGMQRRRVAGMAAIEGILGASDRRVGLAIRDNLAKLDDQLADRVGREDFTFADLLALSDEAVAATVRAADPELLVLALVDAPPQWADRLLAMLPSSIARQVLTAIGQIGPLRLRDAEEARQRLTDLALQLAIEGRIAIPAGK